MKNIAIVCGGYSGEYSVSKNSAAIAFKHLEPMKKYNLFLIEITKTGWYYIHNNTKLLVDKNDFSIIINGQKINFDAVLNLIHGTPGEDGLLQGYWDMLDIPYSSSSTLVSALTFNKEICKQIAHAYGAKIAPAVFLHRHTPYNTTKILEVTGLPCFIKPNKGGSSIGMSKVYNADEIDAAIQRAFEEDNEIQIEKFLDGTEITCGVLQKNNQIEALPITEIVSKNDFFDFEAKYDNTLADEITPARISPELTKQCQELSVELYKKIGCSGLVRIDYIFAENTLFFLEINTIPGMSEASIVPKQADYIGMPLSELFDCMIKNIL